MASPDKVLQLIILSDNTLLKRRILNKTHYNRKYGVHPINQRRRRFGEYHHLFLGLRKDQIRFFEYTRMSIETFDYILGKISHLVMKKREGLGQQVTPEERLVVTLRFLATGATFRHLAFEFRLGRSAVSNIVYETCSAIVEQFCEEAMPTPTEDHLKQVAERYFTLWKFPNCIGAIDGRHCELKCPPHSGSSYFNYLKYFSIVLMGVADADKKFIVIDVGARGKQSDGGVFIATELYNRLERNQFNVPPAKNLPGTNISVPHVLIGDEAFPLKSYLMRPFPAKNLSIEQEIYNNNLSTARKTIECAFGILRSKWRFLGTAIEIPTVSKVCLLVKTACILHNIIRDRDGANDNDYKSYLRGEHVQERENAPGSTPELFRRPNEEAVAVRNYFKNYFLLQI